jgi:phospholipase C
MHSSRVLRVLVATALAGITAVLPASAGSVLAGPARVPSSAAGSAADQPCGRRAQPPRTYDHVVWIVLENHSYDELVGEPGSPADLQAPYLNALARSCGLATDFRAITHPSLPNYLAMVSGRTGGVADSCRPSQCPQRRRTVFDQVRASGGRWRVLAEAMPGPCRRTDAYPYVVRHNPPTYFPETPGCRRNDLPMGTPTSGRLVDLVADGRLPRLTVVIPDQCHNTHDCDVPAGDEWLEQVVPQVLDGPDYRAGRTALFITYDEGAGGVAGQSCRRDYDESCHVVTVVVAPSVLPGTRSSVRVDHYGLLKTTERMLGIRRLLGHAGDDRTRSLRAAFRM